MAGSTNVGQIDLSLILNDNKFKTQLKQAVTDATKSSNSMSSAFSKMGKALIAAFSVAKIVQFGKTCVKVATETSNAWIGLNSILTGQGKSFNKAKEFINEYVSDGLVPLNNAVTAYKNLSLRGYNSEQIQKVMNALKNSATFARQSTYSLGDAVQTATEGLKNENSVVVDNAGVTKNVAKMWDDYAKSIGTTRNNLTQAQKIQAEVNGILEETKFQSNDAAIYASTYSGKLAQLNTAFINMKTAIGNVIQPIAKLFIPILTAAANAVTKLFTAISGLFATLGYETDFEIASKKIEEFAGGANGASNALGGIGDSATQAEKDTKKAAKEIKKSLAGFDEMNILNDNSSSGTGSGGSGSSGGGGSTGISIDTSNASKDMSKTSDFLNGINFTPLINAFNNLKSAAEPIIKNIKDGLKWLYDNVLEPLAKWTIEDALPAFLNLVAGALRVLNPLIEAFKPIFQWFWDNFLQPIASWTGGVIVSVLNTLADALDKVGKWMSDNQSTITNMEIAVLGFFGAWKTVEIMSFIQQTGGLVGAFSRITKAIWACTGAKIVDKAETMYLNLLYAKDFVLSIASTTKALVKQAVQWGINTALKIKDKMETLYLNALYAKDLVVSIASGTAALIKQAAQWVVNTAMKVANTAATIASTAATVAATAATWLFNAALAVLTSPITLVVAAIAGLIAIIVLLVKNWDTVKEATSKCWEKIKTTIKEKANNIKEAISNTFNNIKSFIISTLTNIINKVKYNFNVMRETISTIMNVISSTISNIWNGIKTTISNVLSTLGTIIANIWNSIKNTILNVINNIKESITTIFNNIKNTISMVFNTIKTIASNIWNNIKNNIVNSVTNIKDRIVNTFQTAYNRVTSIFSNIGNFFSGIWNRIKGTFSNLGTSIGNAISNSVKRGINGVISMIQNTINRAINLINGAIGLINKIPGVDIGKIRTLRLPRLAQGGYVKANTPQLAMIGDNRTQGEIVAPENKLLEMNLKALKMFNEQNGSNNITSLDSQAIERLGKAIGKYATINANIVNTMNGRIISREMQKIQANNDFAYNT